MCSEKITDAKARKDLENSRANLRKSVDEGHETICKYIAGLISTHITNKTSSDGNKKIWNETE